MENVLKIEQLTYKKNAHTILQNVNLSLKPGKIVALLGANGSGKTTLMRIVAGVAKNWSGTVEVMGETKDDLKKTKLAFTDKLSAFPDITKISYIKKFYTTVYPDFDEDEFNKIIQFMKLNESMRLNQLSKGMKEKLIIALVFSQDADLYLLDEPFGGIDIMTRKNIINSILLWKNDNSTILLSDHYLGEIANLVDEVAILKDKAIIDFQEADDIRAKHKSIEEYYTSFYNEEEDE